MNVMAQKRDSTGVPSLRRSFAWMTAGNVVYASSQWAALVVIAKLGSPEMLGQFALGQAVATPVMQFADIRLRSVQATDATRSNSFGDYLGLRTVTTVGAMLVIAAVGWELIHAGKTTAGLVVMLIGAAKAFENVSDVFYGLFQQREKMRLISASLTARGVLALLGLTAALLLTRSIVWGAGAICLSWAGIAAFYDARRGRQIQVADGSLSGRIPNRPCFDVRALSALTRLASPLGVVAVLWSLNATMPRYFVAAYRGQRELGVFAAMATLAFAGQTIIFSLGNTGMPRLSVYHAHGQYKRYRNLVLKMMCAGTAMGIAGIALAAIAGDRVVMLLYSRDFAGCRGVLTWLMVAAGAAYPTGVYIYSVLAARMYREVLWAALLATAAQAALCVPLIGRGGLLGASGVLIAVPLLQAGMLALFVARTKRKRVRDRSKPMEDV